MKTMPEEIVPINVLPPVADAFAGTATTDIVSVADCDSVTFIIQKGVGTTGTSTITVEACDDVSASNTTAVPFIWQQALSSDVFSAPEQVAATGKATTAGSNHLYKVHVPAENLASTGYGYVRLKGVEVVNDPVLAGVVALRNDLRDTQAINKTALV